MHGKNTTVLEMEFCVLDFITVTDTPWSSEQNDPQSILVLLTNDLVAIDCKSTGEYLKNYIIMGASESNFHLFFCRIAQL